MNLQDLEQPHFPSKRRKMKNADKMKRQPYYFGADPKEELTEQLRAYRYEVFSKTEDFIKVKKSIECLKEKGNNPIAKSVLKVRNRKKNDLEEKIEELNKKIRELAKEEELSEEEIEAFEERFWKEKTYTLEGLEELKKKLSQAENSFDRVLLNTQIRRYEENLKKRRLLESKEEFPDENASDQEKEDDAPELLEEEDDEEEEELSEEESRLYKIAFELDEEDLARDFERRFYTQYVQSDEYKDKLAFVMDALNIKGTAGEVKDKKSKKKITLVSQLNLDRISRFFDLLHIKGEDKRTYRPWGKKPMAQSKDSIIDIFEKKKIQKNRFFSINETPIKTKKGLRMNRDGKIYAWKKEYEQRSEHDLTAFNSFYFDVDFKADGKSIEDESILRERKREFLISLKKMSVKPSAVVKSRNGYHLYYAIAEQDRHMALYEWQEIEYSIHKYIQENITPYIDPVVKDASRVLRIPGTIHHKPGTKPYLVKLLYITDRRYTAEELLPIMSTTVYEPKKIEDSRPRVSTPKEMNQTIEAIRNLNVDFFDLPKYDVELSITDAKNMIKQLDMIEFLGLHVKPGQCFSSVLRPDNHPSCAIYLNETTNEYWYRDFSEKKDRDIINIVQEIAGVDFMKALCFVCHVYGIRTISSKKAFTKEENTIVFEMAVNRKELRWAIPLTRIYKAVMQLWETRGSTRTSALQIGCEYFAEYYNSMFPYHGKSVSTIKNHLLVLEYCGLLRRKPIKQSRAYDNDPPNEFFMVDASNIDIVSRLTELREHIPNTYRDISLKKIRELKEEQESIAA